MMKEVTLDHAIEQLGFGRFQIYLFIILTIIVGGEAVEFFVISYTLPYVICDFGLNSRQAALISIIFFLCVMIGSFVWGYLADNFGRQRCLVLSELLMSYFGILSAAAPSVSWFIVLRGITGFSLSGSLATAYPLFMELVPVVRRNYLHSLHGAAGGLMGVTLLFSGSYLVDLYGWRPLMVLAAVPSIVGGILTIAFVPHSPRFLIVNGRGTEAQKILYKIAKMNKISNVGWTVRDNFTSKGQKGVLLLFARENLRLTIPILITSFTAGFIHYSTVLMSIYLSEAYIHRCPSNLFRHESASPSDSSCKCKTEFYFLPITLGTAGEIMSFIFPGPMAFWLGRQASLITAASLVVVFGLINIFCKSLIAVALTLFFNRAVATGLLLLIDLFTTEAYPTSVRAVGVGCGYLACRLGNMLAPLLVQIFLPLHPLWQSMMILISLGVVTIITVLVLPFETKERFLYETFSETKDAIKESSKPSESTNLVKRE